MHVDNNIIDFSQCILEDIKAKNKKENKYMQSQKKNPEFLSDEKNDREEQWWLTNRVNPRSNTMTQQG